jgi:hypothetical protein
MNSTSHFGLDYVYLIIYIYDFVDVQWDSVEYETIVDIHSFGIFVRWFLYLFYRPNTTNFGLGFHTCRNVRECLYQGLGTLFLVT